METIVFAGTKLNISYWIDEILDEDDQEELHDYFMEADSDAVVPHWRHLTPISMRKKFDSID